MQIQFILVLEHVVTGDALEAHVERRVVHVRQVPPQVGNGLLTTLALRARVAGGGGEIKVWVWEQQVLRERGTRGCSGRFSGVIGSVR